MNITAAELRAIVLEALWLYAQIEFSKLQFNAEENLDMPISTLQILEKRMNVAVEHAITENLNKRDKNE